MPFCELTSFMSDDQDIRRSLARAFDRAWEGYYRSGRVTISQDVARTELARKLVQLSKDGVRDEVRLSAADSLLPGRSLVAGQKVSITARISFSGQPLPVAGDLYGELTYDVGHDGVRELVIDRIAQ